MNSQNFIQMETLRCFSEKAFASIGNGFYLIIFCSNNGFCGRNYRYGTTMLFDTFYARGDKRFIYERSYTIVYQHHRMRVIDCQLFDRYKSIIDGHLSRFTSCDHGSHFCQVVLMHQLLHIVNPIFFARHDYLVNLPMILEIFDCMNNQFFPIKLQELFRSCFTIHAIATTSGKDNYGIHKRLTNNSSNNN